jgi:hypothetical protein
VIDGFEMKLKIKVGNKDYWIKPATSWQYLDVRIKSITIDKNFYIKSKKI